MSAQMSDAEMFVGSWLASYKSAGLLVEVPAEEGTPSAELYGHFAAYVEWRRTGGLARVPVPTMTAWGRQLTERGYPARSTATCKTRPLRIVTAHPDGLEA